MSGIGMRNESSLHSAIKRWYARPGDLCEVSVGGYVVDILRNGLIVEVQTRNFAAIRDKVRKLLKTHDVRVVYPVSERKWIVRVDASDGSVLSRRRSPKRGRLSDVFGELIRIPDLVSYERFCLEVILIHEEEVRCDDGRGSWRRRGVSILDRKLLEVVGSTRYANERDYLPFLPADLPSPFSNKSLATALAAPLKAAQRMTYCMKKMHIVREVGKEGNALLFERNDP